MITYFKDLKELTKAELCFLGKHPIATVISITMIAVGSGLQAMAVFGVSAEDILDSVKDDMSKLKKKFTK